MRSPLVLTLFCMLWLAPAGAQTAATARLTPEELAQAENALAQAPDDLALRTRLLRHYRYGGESEDLARAARRRHILWLIQHHPEAPVLIRPEGTIEAVGSRLADAEGFTAATKAWREQLATAGLPSQAVVNAVTFFRFTDRPFALQMLNRALQTSQDGTLLRAKGMLFALSLTGATGADANGTVSSFEDDPATSLAAKQARAELDASASGALLLGAGAALTNLYGTLVHARPLAAPRIFEFAEQYLQRAVEKLPGEPEAATRLSSLYTAAGLAARDTAEQIRLFERAASRAPSVEDRSYALDPLAQARLEAGQWDAAARDASALLEVAAAMDKTNWNYGNALHHGNIVLGEVALHKGDLDGASARLLAAGKTPGSPQLNSFGPNWGLAQKLLSCDRRDAVLQYIALCRVFWKGKDRLLDRWTAAIGEGATPDFSALANTRTSSRAGAVNIMDFNGKPAPEFSMKDLAGKEHTLADYRGKLVVLDFWATWCMPCRAELPSFERLHRELAAKDVVVLAVDVGESPDTVGNFIREQKYTFPVLLGEDRTVSDKYGITAFPTTLVIDPAGRVVDIHVGVQSETRLKEVIGRGRARAGEAK